MVCAFVVHICVLFGGSHQWLVLSSFLPKKPTDVELKVIKEMFEASVDGQAYDTTRWGQYFRPAGVQAPAGSSAPVVADVDEDTLTPKVIVKPAPVASSFDDEEDAPAPTAPVAAAKPAQKAEDILAMIRARQKQ